MASPSPIDRAIEIVRRAIKEDINQNYAEAYKQYRNSLDYFMVALKFEKNDESKKLIRAKIDEYLTRAEKLKAYLISTQKNTAGVDGASGGVGEGKK